jgi:hypothetical protein
MSTLMIRDLPQSRVLEHGEMSGVRGGYALRDIGSLPGIAVKVEPIVNVNQNIVQLQNIGVNVLNNNGYIGAIPDLKFDVSGKQWARNNFAI